MESKSNIESFTKVEGTVSRLFNKFGFISVSRPVEASVFFDAQAFEDGRYVDLTVSGLMVDEEVILDAKKGPRGCRAEFRAIRVCRPQYVTRTQVGIIDSVDETYGFIRFGPNGQKCAFFHLNDVVVPSIADVKAVHSIFNIGDEVRFEVEPSEKPTKKAQWQATAVYLLEERFFLEEGEKATLTGVPRRFEETEEERIDSPRRKGPQEKPGTTGETSSRNKTALAATRGKSEKCLPISIRSDVEGKVVEVTKGVGRCEVEVNGSTKKVTVTNDRFYKDGAPCKDLTKVLRVGDKVRLEYMLGTDGRTGREQLHCDLAWRGPRPVEVAPRLTPEQFAKDLNITTCFADGSDSGGDSEDDFSFCDEIKEYKGRRGCLEPLKLGNHRRPTDELPRHGEAGGGGKEAAAGASSLADASEETLQRMAAILAEKIRNLSGPHGTVRDVATQTSTIPTSLPTSEGTGEPLLHTGTQTISTGTIVYADVFTS